MFLWVVGSRLVSHYLRGTALEDFIRDAASTYHHQTCTAKMGRDSMSVVGGQLKVYGIENLRIADGSIMPRDHRQYHGSVHHHRRACRGSLAERAQVRQFLCSRSHRRRNFQMFLGRLANPAIATKCKQDSLGADEVQVELGGRLSSVTTREIPFVQGEQHNVNWK